VTRTEKDGSVTVLAGQFNGVRLSGPVDLIYAIDGSVYFTDSGVGSTADNGRPVKSPAVYQITRTQIPGASRLQKVSEEYERPAGVTVGPKQNLLYVSDAGRKNIRVHEIRADGSLSPSRVFAELGSKEPGEVGGLETDEKGHVYAAGPGGLWVFSAAGRHLGTVVFAEPPVNCCWGAGFSGLYVSAGTSVYHVGSRVAGTRTF
jgi:gluconolactonase